MPTLPDAHRPPDQLSEEALHNLCGALTVIRGHTQLLMRRTHGVEPLDPGMFRTRLTAIDAMVSRLAQALTVLHIEPNGAPATAPGPESTVLPESRGPSGRH